MKAERDENTFNKVFNNSSCSVILSHDKIKTSTPQELNRKPIINCKPNKNMLANV